MVGVQGCSSPLPAVGMLIGFVLLGFAGVVVLTPSSSSAGAAQFLPRRLQDFGYITPPPRPPSSFDSVDSSSSASFLEPSKSFESGSMESSDIDVVLPKIQAGMGSSMGYVTVSLLIQLLFAVCYNKVVVAPVIAQFNGTLDDRMMTMNDEFKDNDFQNGFFSFKHPWVCAQGLFCPVVRIASTNAVAGVCGFWETMWCYCCCAWLTVGTGPVCLVMFWRMRLKDIMRTEQNALTDFFLTLLCPQVSMCQMSVAVEEKMGYTTTGCCTFAPYSYGGPMEQLN